MNKKTFMGIEEYAKSLPQYYGMTIPKTLKKYLDKTTFKTIIDCGCGDGALIYVLNKRGYFKDKKVIGVDLSQNRINLIRKINPKIQAFVDDAEKLKHIKNDSIDFFMSTHVIEHVNDKTMLGTIGRVVKKGGTIYIATIFKKWYGWYYYRKDGKWVMDVTHLREYKHDKELIDIVNKKIFRVLETKKTQLYFPIIDFVIRRLFMNNLIKNREVFIHNPVFNFLRNFRIPVPGYYNWEIILKKK